MHQLAITCDRMEFFNGCNKEVVPAGSWPEQRVAHKADEDFTLCNHAIEASYSHGTGGGGTKQGHTCQARHWEASALSQAARSASCCRAAVPAATAS
eukprot:scaffold185590_cov33-Prasinocladus_malaysianus.AAC.1